MAPAQTHDGTWGQKPAILLTLTKNPERRKMYRGEFTLAPFSLCPSPKNNSLSFSDAIFGSSQEQDEPNPESPQKRKQGAHRTTSPETEAQNAGKTPIKPVFASPILKPQSATLQQTLNTRSNDEWRATRIAGIWRAEHTGLFKEPPTEALLKDLLSLDSNTQVSVHSFKEGNTKILIDCGDNVTEAVRIRDLVSSKAAFQIELPREGPWVLYWYWRGTYPSFILGTLRELSPTFCEYDPITGTAAVHYNNESLYKTAISPKQLSIGALFIPITPIPTDENCFKMFPMATEARSVADNHKKIVQAVINGHG
jgi:hypothetical protein